MPDTRVLISGAGKMGREVAKALKDAPDLYASGFLDPLAADQTVDGLPAYRDIAEALDATTPDAIVDFSNAAFTPDVARAALDRGIPLVIGTTGHSADFMVWLEIEAQTRKVGVVVAANFAIGAVLMMYFARQAARHFDWAEVIELHHNQKVDAPSGTAKATVEQMLAARGRPFDQTTTEMETVPGARGAELGGIAIHSVRLPGYVAHQEVILGGLGQTLTIRHDTTGRESFMPGVLTALRALPELDHLVVGMDALLGLE